MQIIHRIFEGDVEGCKGGKEYLESIDVTSISTSPSSSCSADSGPSAILFAGSFGKLVDRWLYNHKRTRAKRRHRIMVLLL